jgi:outer membrane protein OmpA-like peptidoglycan-associated protein
MSIQVVDGGSFDFNNEIKYLDTLIKSGDYGQQEWAKAQKETYLKTETAPEVKETTSTVSSRGNWVKQNQPDDNPDDRQTIRGVDASKVTETINTGLGYDFDSTVITEGIKDALPDFPSLPELPDGKTVGIVAAAVLLFVAILK